MTEAWWMPGKPGELRDRPWICPAAEAFFEMILQPEWRVLEHGCGGSTVWLAKRVKEVVAVENRADWMKAVEGRALGNVKLMVWDKPMMPKLKGKFDLIFIDGEPVENRAGWLRAASELLAEDGWVVLDNANRPEYAQEREALEQLAARKVGFRDAAGKYFATEFYHVIKAPSSPIPTPTLPLERGGRKEEGKKE